MILLGSTGSIGVNALAIIREFGLGVEVLVAGHNIPLLASQIAEFRPKIVVVATQEGKTALGTIDAKVLVGEEGICEAITLAKGRLVINALVGYLGLRPTLTAIALGKKVALANKESLVTAGKFIDASKLTPIDSEHFGLWYLLASHRTPKTMTITASGGAFRDTPLASIEHATVDQALAHPNWRMGRKITIDSATMTNKLFELLEARWLFGDKVRYDALIETKSVIHAMIEFSDGVTTAQLSPTDMRLPIAYALLGELDRPLFPPVDLVTIGSLEFRPITQDRYPVWEVKEPLLANPELGVVVNAVNEIAIEQFFAGKISFGGISRLTLEAFKTFENVHVTSVDDVFRLDHEVRGWAYGH